MLITIVVAYVMYKSRWGRQVRASCERIMAGAVGINTAESRSLHLALACGIAGLPAAPSP